MMFAHEMHSHCLYVNPHLMVTFTSICHMLSNVHTPFVIATFLLKKKWLPWLNGVTSMYNLSDYHHFIASTRWSFLWSLFLCFRSTSMVMTWTLHGVFSVKNLAFTYLKPPWFTLLWLFLVLVNVVVLLYGKNLCECPKCKEAKNEGVEVRQHLKFCGIRVVHIEICICHQMLLIL